MNTKVNMSLEDRLKCSLSYDPDTGKIFWKDRFKGREAFTTVDAKGYRRGAVGGVTLYAHRVAWFLHHGKWPVDQIDHINGVRDDNRSCNLRQVNNIENNKNRKKPKHNKSGVVGVYWHSLRKKWAAQIVIEGKDTHLGLFSCIAQAIKVRREAEERYGYHPNHGKR